MLYLGIDQHSKQLTISLRDEDGSVTRRRQVSTRPEKVETFLQELCEAAEPLGGFMAIVEVCGFNDWLVAMLGNYECREIVLIHPDKRDKRKTDRRDANALSELLWLNRERLTEGRRPRGLRRVVVPTRLEQQMRELTSSRQRLGRLRTRTINQMQGLMRRYNLVWESPTKNFQTKAVARWLRELTTSRKLSRLDRLQLSQWLDQWQLYDDQLEELNEQIDSWSRFHRWVNLLRTIPGMGAYSGLAIASRIGDIRRFPHPRSLGNYFGLTPSCRNSGEAKQRLGSITKDGSRIVRFLLGQLVLHVLKNDAWMRNWYRQIKQRRGSKIARVAVMRRITTIIWHMLWNNESYQAGGPR